MAVMSLSPSRAANSRYSASIASKARVRVVDQVHLVDGEHDAGNAEQVHEVAVTARLRQHALAGVDQDHRQVRGRGAGHHVARVLLVARRVGDDELAPLGGEEAVGDVDGDALLALGRQPIDEQREVELAAVGADALRESASSGASWSSKISFDSYSSRPISVDLPSSTEPQVMKRSRLLCSCAAGRRRCRVAISSDW